jgi:hypothetical protein
MTTQNDITPADLVREVERLFADHLASGQWVPLTRLLKLIPDDLAAARCRSSGPDVVADLADPNSFGREALAREALKVLEDSGEYETREFDGKQEVRLERPTAERPGAALAPSEVPAAEAAGPPSPPQPTPEIIIDPEFSELIRPHTDEERAQLEKNLQDARCCRDRLVLWKGTNILLEGHLRHELCRKLGLPVPVTYVELPNREAAKEWIIDNQRGRRNLTPEEYSCYRGQKYNARKQPHGGDRRTDGASAHAEQMPTTAEQIGKQEGVSPATVRRDGEFAEALDKIGEACGSETRQTILSGKSGLTRQEVVEITKAADPATLKQAVRERLQKGGDTRKPKRKGASQGQANGKKPAPAARPAAPDSNTLSLAEKPAALALALLEGLGRQRARQVHQALGKLLAGDGRPAGASPRKPAASRPR